MEYQPKIGQTKTTPKSAGYARRILAAIHSPEELDAMPRQRLRSKARAALRDSNRILDAVYTPQELSMLPDARILREAHAFEDARGAARTGLGA